MKNNNQVTFDENAILFKSSRANMNALSQIYIDNLLIYKTIVKSNLSVNGIKKQDKLQVSSPESGFGNLIAF